VWNWLYLEEAGEQQQRLESSSILSTQEDGEGEEEDEDNSRMEKSVSVQFREEELTKTAKENGGGAQERSSLCVPYYGVAGLCRLAYVFCSVVDPGSSAFLTPGSWIRFP
jgi:hypothetical protein